MSKFIKIFTVSAFAFAVFAFTADAATITHIEFEDGQTTYQGEGGETVNATFRVVVGPTETVEFFQTNIAGSVQSPKCESVGGNLGLQEGTHFIDRSLKFPPNTGTYTVNTKASGIFGGFRAIDCSSNVVATASFSSALKTVGSSNGSGSGSVDDTPSWLQALLTTLTNKVAELTSQVEAIQNPPVPAGPQCPPAYYGGNRVAVQSWLMSNGYASGFNAVGISGPWQLSQPGIIWGAVSSSAYSQALNACN